MNPGECPENTEEYNTLKHQKIENYKTFILFHMPLSIYKK
jgi:hypothetical protein